MSDKLASLSTPKLESGLRYFLSHRSRRIVTALLLALTGLLLTTYAAAMGIEPGLVLAPTATIIALMLVVDASIVFSLSTAIEVVLVRLAGRSANYHGAIMLLFGAYASALGWLLGVGSLTISATVMTGLLAWSVFAPLLRYVTRVLFYANLRGPTRLGTVAVLTTVLLPFWIFSLASLQPNLVGWLAVVLIVFGGCCIGRVSWIALVYLVESIQVITDMPQDNVQAKRIMRLVRSTEKHLNRSRIERGAVGFATCYIVYWLGGYRNKHYRRAFLNLRVQRFFAVRRYDKIIKLTNDKMTGSLGYLRVQSLIRTHSLNDAESILTRALADHPTNPYLWLASAHIQLERFGFFSVQYRTHIAKAREFAKARLNGVDQELLQPTWRERYLVSQSSKRDRARHICPDAIAEYAKVAAYDTALSLSANHTNDERRRAEFHSCLFEVREARRLADKHSVRLASEIRGVEGVVESLAGDYSEGYIAFMDALKSGENLKARYYLAVLLMVNSVSFLRPLYHLERVLALAPAESRLARLALARRDEALDVTRTNRQLSTSWQIFRLLTFDRSYVALAESEKPAWAALAYRDDKKKRDTFKSLFGLDAPTSEPPPPEWARDWSWNALRETRGDPKAARNVRMPETALA